MPSLPDKQRAIENERKERDEQVSENVSCLLRRAVLFSCPFPTSLQSDTVGA